VLLLAPQGGDSAIAAWAMDLLGNVSILERPLRITSLVSALRTALRSRRRQYELRDRLAQLREADRRKDEFLATLAHELRNPLAPIQSALQLLRAKDAQPPRHVLEMLERQVRHMVRLVDDLLEIARITRGRVGLRKECVEVGDIARSALEASRPLIEAGRHELALDLPAESLVVEADPVRMTQVLTNLLNNAAKYTPVGGRIALAARRDEDQVELCVRDNGAGIQPEMLARIFEPFSRGRLEGGCQQHGLGIGLALARAMVRLHGGTIEAKSAGLGRGSEFVVRIPALADGVQLPRSTDGVRPRAAAIAGRVLVVDDNRDAADSLGLLLGLQGLDVAIAYDGRSALDAMHDRRPQAVFLDIGMPDMDGLEVARAVRRDPELSGVVLIALTGWSQEEDVRRSRAAGFDHHLVKPVNVDSSAVQDLLASLKG
jgi:signal transduction histidine kinase